MKTTATVFAVLLAIGAALPAMAQPATAPTPGQPRDVGNMAYPTPLPQGNVSSTMPGNTRDTSSSSFPAPLPQGNVGTTATGGVRAPTDTGNMAYPAPVPQGQVGTTTVK